MIRFSALCPRIAGKLQQILYSQQPSRGAIALRRNWMTARIEETCLHIDLIIYIADSADGMPTNRRPYMPTTHQIEEMSIRQKGRTTTLC